MVSPGFPFAFSQNRSLVTAIIGTVTLIRVHPKKNCEPRPMIQVHKGTNIASFYSDLGKGKAGEIFHKCLSLGVPHMRTIPALSFCRPKHALLISIALYIQAVPGDTSRSSKM